jgi:hypothetical protein
MEAGFEFHEMTVNLFQQVIRNVTCNLLSQIDKNEAWYESHNLNSLLAEYFQRREDFDFQEISLEFYLPKNETLIGSHTSVNILQNLQLQYQVALPINQF